MKTPFLNEEADALIAELARHHRPTALHAERVGEFARKIAVVHGFTGKRLHRLYLAARLHDIGKLTIPVTILDDPRPLDALALAGLRRQPIAGAAISRVLGVPEIEPFIRGHHERVDGTGYPDAVPARTLPLEARIIAVADAFDAMINDWPYRVAMTPRDALHELERAAGPQFDRHVVAALHIALAVDDHHRRDLRLAFGGS